MKIAVYTGTFNPLHIGHLAIMEYLTWHLDFSMVYLIVSPQSPFKKHMKAETGMERFKAAEEAVSRHPGLKVMVDDIELHLPSPQYTIRTLDMLKAREPDNSFTLICGADNLCEIDRWKDYRRILTEYGVAVYPRKGYDMHAARERLMKEGMDTAVATGRATGHGYRILLMDNAPEVEISSSEIRAGMAEGRDMSRFLM